VISLFVDCLLRGERPTIYGDGEQTRDFSYVSNAVSANMLAAQTSRGIGEVINIANGQQITISELFRTLREILGREDIEAEFKPARTGDIVHSLADISRARELLGFEPKTQLQEGLRLTVAAAREETINRAS
jgi:nucleoside-diphosphate-sugar epimerase